MIRAFSSHDGEFKHTLGVVRDLADAGHEVHLLVRTGAAPALIRARCTRGTRRHRGGRSWMHGCSRSRRGSPGERAARRQLGDGVGQRLRGRWPAGVELAIAPPQAFATANRKDLMAAAARAIGIDTPRERLVANAAEARAALAELGAPLVLK